MDRFQAERIRKARKEVDAFLSRLDEEERKIAVLRAEAAATRLQLSAIEDFA